MSRRGSWVGAATRPCRDEINTPGRMAVGGADGAPSKMSGMDARSRRVAARFEVPVLLAALATIPALLLEQGHPAEPWRMVAQIADWVIWFVFAVELVVLLAVVPSRKRWLRDNPVDVAIVILTLPFLSGAIQSVRVLRLLRLLRLARVAPIARRLFSLEGLRYASLLALLALVSGAEAFASAENVSVGNGVYWALTTMTTVGYGDLTPKTTAGKIVACALMLIGIGFFAMITGAIAQRFLSSEVAQVEVAVEDFQVTEVFVLKEVREIAERLRALEAAVQRQVEARGPP